MMNTEFAMYCLLVPLTTLMTWAIAYRLLFHVTYRLADEASLERWLRTGLNDGSRATRPGLGWVSSVWRAPDGDFDRLRSQVESFQRRIERWHDAQKLLAELAMGVGFLFTVVSLVTESGSKLDASTIIGIGMGSTQYGLCIALPGSFLHGLLHKRVERFLDQTDELLTAIKQRGTTPLATVVPAAVEFAALAVAEARS